MAAWWRSVAIILTYLLIYLLPANQARITDGGIYQYASSVNEYEAEDIDFRPLLRIRRDYSAQNANFLESTAKPSKALSKKATDDTKPLKVDLKKQDELKKSSTTASPPTTSTTTTTTTTSTTTTTEKVQEATTLASNVLDTNGTTTTTTTTTGTTTTSTTVMPILEDSEEENATTPEIEDDSDDPDSGNDTVDPINNLNTVNATVDHHRYYRSRTITGVEEVQQFWVDFDSIGEEKYVHNAMLSASHRRAATVPLTFDFPFYGHRLRNITIATGGFLFTGNFVHTWLAATQYIAPLMANFDTSMSDDASVRYADNGTSFTVQWNNVLLKDHADAGTFTFQVTLHKNGDIVFTYKQVPVVVTSIEDDQHPVKVGLSDAYIVDRVIFFVRRKTIYEYHKIDMKKSVTIGNWTAIFFKALPTCVSFPSCTECLSQRISFQVRHTECQWCPKINRCSNGLDRHRQEWLDNGCENTHVPLVSECANLPPSPSSPYDQDVDTFGREASVQLHGRADASTANQSGSSSVGSVVGVVFLVAVIFAALGWVAYAYLRPHTPSGQILIKYRPSTWAWRRGEARYTAAAIHSIHM